MSPLVDKETIFLVGAVIFGHHFMKEHKIKSWGNIAKCVLPLFMSVFFKIY